MLLSVGNLSRAHHHQMIAQTWRARPLSCHGHRSKSAGVAAVDGAWSETGLFEMIIVALKRKCLVCPESLQNSEVFFQTRIALLTGKTEGSKFFSAIAFAHTKIEVDNTAERDSPHSDHPVPLILSRGRPAQPAPRRLPSPRSRLLAPRCHRSSSRFLQPPTTSGSRTHTRSR